MHKNVQRLIINLAEMQAREDAKPKILSQKLTLQDANHDLKHCINIIISELSLIDGVSDQKLELYLQHSPNCKILCSKGQENKKLTKEHLILNEICQSIACKTKSARILVRFACMTGNVGFLIRAIHYLADQQCQPLRGDELFFQNNDYLQLEQKNQMPILAYKIEQIEAEQEFFTAKQSIIIPELNYCFQKTDNKSIVQYRLNNCKVVDEQQLVWTRVVESDWARSTESLLLTYYKQVEECVVCYQVLAIELKTNKIHRKVLLLRESETANAIKPNISLEQKLLSVMEAKTQIVKIWQMKGQYFISQFIVACGDQSNQIVTSDVNSNLNYAVTSSKQILNFEVIESQGVAVILVKDESGNENLEFRYLLSGQQFLKMPVNKAFVPISFTRKKLVEQEYNKFEYPPCPKPLATLTLKGHFSWQFENKDLETVEFDCNKLSEGKATWYSSCGQTGGTWTYDGESGVLTVHKNDQTYQFVLSSDNGVDLMLLPDKVETAKFIMSDQQSSGVFMIQDKLAKYKPDVECQYYRTDNKEMPKQLIDPGHQPINKWSADNCQDGRSWIKLTFQEQVLFSGIAIKTANNFPNYDPQKIQIYIADSNGNWKFIGSKSFKEGGYERHTAVLTYTGVYRTHAVLLYLINDGKSTQLHLNEVFFYTEVQSRIMQGEILDKTTYTTEVIPQQIERSEQLVSCKLITSFQQGVQSYAVEDLRFPFDQEAASKDLHYKEQQMVTQKYFDYQKSFLPTTLSPFCVSQAVILANMISNQKSKQNKLLAFDWLRIQPSQFYFESVQNFLKSNPLPLLIKMLDKNICDNLHTAVSYNIKLPSLFQDSTDYDSHLRVEPQSYIFYMHITDSVKERIKKIREESLDQIIVYQNKKQLLEPFLVNVLVGRLCVEILQEKLENFEVIFTQLMQNEQFVYARLLIICLNKVQKRLPESLEKVLYSTLSLEQKGILTDLKSDIEFVFFNKVVQRYLEDQDPTANLTYDRMGFLVLTKSELFSGGISRNQIDFFSDTTKSQLDYLAKLSKDELFCPITSSDKEGFCTYLMNKDQNSTVEDIIRILQTELVNKGGLLARQSQFGAETGMLLVRAAFAVMVKLSLGLSEKLEQICFEISDQFDSQSPEERLELTKLNLIHNDDFLTILKIWEHATKMRTWLQYKKQSVFDKFRQTISDELEREQQSETHLNQIYSKILEKAQFMLKLEPRKPNVQQVEIPNVIPFLRNKSQVAGQANEPEFQIQESSKGNDGDIQIDTVTSVLSCLCSPVLLVEIQNQVENSYRAASLRYTGLCLLNDSLTNEISFKKVQQVASCLQKLQIKPGDMCHYLDGIQGVNQQMAEKINKVFFEILQKLCDRLRMTTSLNEGFVILSCLQWHYHAGDFYGLLKKLNIFQLLGGQDANPDSLLGQVWCKVNLDSMKRLKIELLYTFTEIYLQILARTTDPNEVIQTKLNDKTANIVPILKKKRSIVDEDTSSLLIQSGLGVIFACFDSFVKKSAELKTYCSDVTILEQFDKLNDKESQADFLQQKVYGSQKKFSYETDLPTDFIADIKINNTLHQTDQQAVKESHPDLTKIKNQIHLLFQEEMEKYELTYFIKCVKLLTSVSQTSLKAEQILKKSINADYVIILLELLQLVSETNKYQIICIIHDLIKVIAAPFDLSKLMFDKPSLFGNQIADYLYWYAKKEFQESENFNTVCLVVGALKKFDITQYLSELVSQLQNLTPVDQVLLLMLCNCGAQLKLPLTGDKMQKLDSELPETLILMSLNKKISTLYNKNTQKVVRHTSNEVILCNNQAKPLCLPQLTDIITMLKSNETSSIVKVMLVNALLKHRTEFNQAVEELQSFLTEYISINSLKHVEWCKSQQKLTKTYFISDEIETLHAVKLTADSITPPKQELTLQPVQNNKRSLVKKLFKKDGLKDTEMWWQSQTLSVSDIPYYFIQEQIFKNDYLQKIEFERHLITQKQYIQKNQRVKDVFCAVGDNSIIKETLLKSLPLSTQTQYQLKKIGRLFSCEFRPNRKISQANISKVAQDSSPEILLLQRITELLFQSYQPSKVEADDYVLWLLCRYWDQKKLYDTMKCVPKYGLTSRLLQILTESPQNFQHLFIQRKLRQLEQQARFIMYSQYNTDFHTVQVIFKLIENNFYQFGQLYIIKLIEVILLLLNRYGFFIKNHLDQDSLQNRDQKYNRKYFQIISRLVQLIKVNQNKEILTNLCENNMLKQLFAARQKIQKIKQYKIFIYQLQLATKELQLQISTLATEWELETQFQFLKINSNEIATFLDFEQVDDKIGWLRSISKLQEWPANSVQVNEKNLEKWIKIDSDEQERNFQVRLSCGSAIIALSDDPEFNESTEFKMVNQEFSQQLSNEKPTYVMFSPQALMILNYDEQELVLIEGLNVPDLTENYELVCVEAGDNEILKFLTCKEGTELYLVVEGEGYMRQLRQVSGIVGKVTSIKWFRGKSANYIAIFVETAIPYLLYDWSISESPTVRSFLQHTHYDAIGFVNGEDFCIGLRDQTLQKIVFNEQPQTQISKIEQIMSINTLEGFMGVTRVLQIQSEESNNNLSFILDARKDFISEPTTFLLRLTTAEDGFFLTAHLEPCGTNFDAEGLTTNIVFGPQNNYAISLDSKGNFWTISSQGIQKFEDLQNGQEQEKNVSLRLVTDSQSGILIVKSSDGKETLFDLKTRFNLKGYNKTFSKQSLKNLNKFLAKPDLKFLSQKQKIQQVNQTQTQYINIQRVEYSIDDNSESTAEFTINQMEQCIAYLEQKFSKINYEDLYRSLVRKNQSLNQVLKPIDYGEHNQDLVNLIINANQFLLSQRAYLQALAHDYQYSQKKLAKYRVFCDYFGIPCIIFLLQNRVQRTLGQKENYFTYSFHRINSKASLFEQLFHQVYDKSTEVFSTTCKPFQCRFIQEAAYDAGGPFRDFMENICIEILDKYFEPTSNSLEEETFLPKLLNNSFSDMQRFLLIGKMIGWALQSKSFNLSLMLNNLFWKRVCGQEITIQDLKSVDQFRYKMLMEAADGCVDSDFENKLSGKVTVDQYFNLYLEQYQEIYDTIIKGIKAVINNQILGLLTSRSASRLAFSNPQINPEAFISQLNIDSDQNEILNMFQKMIRDFTNQERQLLLKFITGSSRLTSGRDVIRIEVFNDENNDQKYPVAHTCGKYVDVWKYSSVEVMKERFLFAIRTCGEIDADGGINEDYDQEDDQGEGEGESYHGEGEGEGEEESDSSNSVELSNSNIREMFGEEGGSESVFMDYYYEDSQSGNNGEGQGEGEGEGEGE